MPDVPFCDTEFAWTSFTKKPSKMYIVVNHGFIRDSKDFKTDHPTQKPTELFRKILEDFSNGLVYDPFIGSGTTAIASEQLSRQWIGSEINPEYCEIANKRTKAEQDQYKLFNKKEKPNARLDKYS